MKIYGEQEDQWVIYKITNSVNSMVYVGMTNSIKRRALQHESDARAGKYKSLLHRAMIKHGNDKFAMTVIDHAETVTEAKMIECLWIAVLRTFEEGYNLTSGGDGTPGRIVPDEVRQKISAGNKGKPKSELHKFNCSMAKIGVKATATRNIKASLALAGRAVTEQHRARLSEALTGRKRKPLSDEHRAKLSLAMKGREFTAQHRLNISIGKTK